MAIGGHRKLAKLSCSWEIASKAALRLWHQPHTNRICIFRGCISGAPLHLVILATNNKSLQLILILHEATGRG